MAHNLENRVLVHRTGMEMIFQSEGKFAAKNVFEKLSLITSVMTTSSALGKRIGGTLALLAFPLRMERRWKGNGSKDCE